MQTLGLADSTPRTESRLRSLFWPAIRTETDFDYVTRQGFWVCVVVAASTFVFNALAGSIMAGLIDGGFYFLAGLGVRERSRVAAISAFSAYLLAVLVAQRLGGNSIGVISVGRFIFLALLFANIRGNWISARWEKDSQQAAPSIRLNETLGDKFADQLPPFLWPKIRYGFYVLAAVELSVLVFALVAPSNFHPKPADNVSRLESSPRF
jgi:hypothetical protein